MEIKLIKDISIGGKKISYIMGFTLEQRFNAHHYFELRFNHDLLGKPGLIELDDSRSMIGQIITASFGYTTGNQQKFSGIVTNVDLSQSHGYHGVLIVSGYSPTILIDRGPDLGSFYKKTLSSIALAATKEVPKNDLRMVLNPERKKPIEYALQYRESDFEFLNRLSGEYLEWFFYDGIQLNLGKPSSLKEIRMVYGRDIQNLRYGISLAPISANRFTYDPVKNELLQAKGVVSITGRPDLVHAANASAKVYSKNYNQSSSVELSNSAELKQLAENQVRADMDKLLKISGEADNPELGIGTIADISMSVKQANAFAAKSLGKFLITAVIHQIDVEGRYSNKFEGIASTAERIVNTTFSYPAADMILADVFDNADPLGQGRVRVKFKWPDKNIDPTAWLRVITPDAGKSDKVPKNRGFVFVPEIGDQVIVGFEEGNISRPIVMGSIFHGQNGIGGSRNNDQKSMSSKSGHTINMDDSGGMLIKDKTDLNVIAFDGKNAIEITADNNITLQTGKVMIVLDKKNDKIILQAGNIEIRAAEDFTVTGDGAPAKAGKMQFAESFNVSVKEKLSLLANASVKLEGKHISIKGGETVVEGSPVKINS